MVLNTYLTFDGNCREAFEFYRSAFGGEFSILSTYGNAPPDQHIPEAERKRIMHVSLPVGTGTLMGSDCCSAMGPPPVVGNNFTIAIAGESREQCDVLFAKLSDGGTVITPLGEMFWGAYYGMWTDRFGINWLINYTLPET